MNVALFCKVEINKYLLVLVESFASFLTQLAFSYKLVQGFAWVEKSFIGVFCMPSVDDKLGSVQTNLGQEKSHALVVGFVNFVIRTLILEPIQI